MNIIGDIAGQYNTLLALLKKMPEGPVLSVGDMGDRGPRSKEVFELFRNREGYSVLRGNHEQMLIDAIRGGSNNLRLWAQNGGIATMDCFDGLEKISADLVEWLDSLPLWYEEPGLFVSHAAPDWSIPSNDCRDSAMHDFIWSRDEPVRKEGYLRVFGHNSHWGLEYFGGTIDPWALCIDTSRDRILTGLHWPSKVIYQQEYID